jgi:hypothetical protein
VGSPLGVEGDHSHEQTIHSSLLLVLLRVREVQRPSPKQTPSVCGRLPFVREYMFCSPFSAAILLRLTFLLQFSFQEKTNQFFLFSLKIEMTSGRKKGFQFFQVLSRCHPMSLHFIVKEKKIELFFLCISR